MKSLLTYADRHRIVSTVDFVDPPERRSIGRGITFVFYFPARSGLNLHHLFNHRLQHDIPVFHHAMVTLQIDGARNKFIGGDGSAGTSADRLVVDDLFAVQDDGHVPVNQGDVQRLPLSGRLFGGHGWRDAAVQSAHVVRINRFPVAIKHLDLIDAAQVDPAVVAFRNIDFQAEVEIFKFL